MKRLERARAVSATGKAGFESFYENQFGERWKTLRAALLSSNAPVEFFAGGEKTYFLDAASVCAAASLPLLGATEILDMCAAPGGKSIVLSSLMDENARLFANERSSARRNRLVSSLDSCLPETVRKRVFILPFDGSKLCLEKSNNSRFDRILLDAPCSSERHVLLSEKYLSEWTHSRVKTLVREQWSLISSAWRLLAPGGFLLYSTCALCECENDGQIAHLVKKHADAEVVLSPLCAPVSRFTTSLILEPQKTKFGSFILPDETNGAGPIYFSLVRKKIP